MSEQRGDSTTAATLHAMRAMFVCVPDEEITEPIHWSRGPREMWCGATSGISVFDAARVTCTKCLYCGMDT